MGSKYYKFWKKKLNEIQEKMKKAANERTTETIDVSGLDMFGKREGKSRYGNIVISNKNVLKGNAAHVTSLGNLVIREGIMDDFPGKKFRFKVNVDYFLEISLEE